jgi:hypothetical protein
MFDFEVLTVMTEEFYRFNFINENPVLGMLICHVGGVLP